MEKSGNEVPVIHLIITYIKRFVSLFVLLLHHEAWPLLARKNCLFALIL